MVKSGLIFGGIAFLFILGGAVFVAPFCAPCLGLVFGILAGYVACVFDRPADSAESVKKGGYAGAIAGGIALIASLLGSVINGMLLNPANVASYSRLFGIQNLGVTQAQIWISQLGFAVCIGLFDILWMALLGVAGGALWYQITGKNQATTILPPQQPLPPAY